MAQQLCTPREYQQWKDDTKTPAGRLLVALEHCKALSMEQYWLGYPARQQACAGEAQKAIDALKLTGDDAATRWAAARCQGPPPGIK